MEENLVELIRDEKKRKAFGKKSLELTSSFSIEKHIQRTLFVYNEVIKEYPRKINDIDVMKRMAKTIK